MNIMDSTAPSEFYDKSTNHIKKVTYENAKRPGSITAAALLFIIIAALHIVLGIIILNLISDYGVPAYIASFVSVVVMIKFVLAAFFFIAAVGMLMMKSWARKLGLVLAFSSFFLSVLSLQNLLNVIDVVLYLVLIWLLMRTDVRTVFD
jgi:hypothetical protein